MVAVGLRGSWRSQADPAQRLLRTLAEHTHFLGRLDVSALLGYLDPLVEHIDRLCMRTDGRQRLAKHLPGRRVTRVEFKRLAQVGNRRICVAHLEKLVAERITK